MNNLLNQFTTVQLNSGMLFTHLQAAMSFYFATDEQSQYKQQITTQASSHCLPKRKVKNVNKTNKFTIVNKCEYNYSKIYFMRRKLILIY